MARKRDGDSATVTSKGQMTLPKRVRDHLGIVTGDRLDVAVEGERIVLIPKTLHLSDICSILPAPKSAASIDDMDEAIARGAIGE
ncbi:MAG: AbrB/MazE/SpoVT family DNA-binding domain-containing protein [Candidatus Tumulicola sp.]